MVVERRAIEAEQPADAEQGEAEAQLDRRELGRDDDQQREALAAVGQLGVEDADRLDLDNALELQFERAGIFALVGIEIKEAAAAEAAAVDVETDAVGRLEARVELHRPEIAALCGKLAINSTPMRSTDALNGPSSPRTAAESSSGIVSSLKPKMM